jgi:hypothetical protein
MGQPPIINPFSKYKNDELEYLILLLLAKMGCFHYLILLVEIIKIAIFYLAEKWKVTVVSFVVVKPMTVGLEHSVTRRSVQARHKERS